MHPKTYDAIQYAYAVWTCWNETSQCLNYGHYNLPGIEDCEKVFEEFYNNGK